MTSREGSGKVLTVDSTSAGRQATGTMAERFQRVFKARGWLMSPPLLFVLLSRHYEYESDWLTFGLGGAIFAFALLLRIWAQMHLRHRLTVHTSLTTTGPYAHVRNPLYVGNTLMFLGLCVMSELVWFCPLMLLWCAVLYTIVVRYEETHLAPKYGTAYRQYLQNVPCWIPRLFSKAAVPFADKRHLLIPSFRAEAHCLFLVMPFILKELLA